MSLSSIPNMPTFLFCSLQLFSQLLVVSPSIYFYTINKMLLHLFSSKSSVDFDCKWCSVHFVKSKNWTKVKQPKITLCKAIAIRQNPKLGLHSTSLKRLCWRVLWARVGARPSLFTNRIDPEKNKFLPSSWWVVLQFGAKHCQI